MATLTGGALTGGALGDASLVQATEDTLFGGRLVLFQPPRGAGYRTNVDALLLAAFAAGGQVKEVEEGGEPKSCFAGSTRRAEGSTRRAEVAFDLGAGVGAVGLSLLRFEAIDHVVFVEVDRTPAAMARRNLDANGWAHRGEVVCGDVRDVAKARRGEASLVVCNPPYVAPGRGRVPRAEERARMGDVEAFVLAARQLAGRRARVCFVYPSRELATLMAVLAKKGLHAKRLRLVHATAASPARVVLLEARAGRPGGLQIVAPLVEREAGGYTAEMQALLAQD